MIDPTVHPRSTGTDVRADATPPSRGRAPGPSYYESITSTSKAGPDDDIRVVEVETDALRRARRRRVGRFLKGPIPMCDLAAAARLPGKALAVYLAVHHRAALTRSPRLRLPAGLLVELGVDKHAKARALRHLETAGLIRVERQSGRSPLICLTTPTGKEPSDEAERYYAD